MSIGRRLGLSWVAAALAPAWLVAGGCGQSSETQAPAALPDGPQLEQRFFDQQMVETEDGVRQWILKSEQMDQFTRMDDVVLVTVTMDFYRDGVVFSTLTADSGLANTRTRDVKAWGDVLVVTNDGRRLETQELYFDNKTQLISNDVFDRYTWPEGEATGIGIEATPDLEYFEIKRSFRSEFSDEAAAQEERP